MLLSPLNHLFQLAQTGKRLPHILLAVPISVIFVLVAQLTGGILALLLVVLPSLPQLMAALETGNSQAVSALLLPDTAIEQTIFLVLAFGPIFLLLWGWLALVEKRPFWTMGLELEGAAWKYLRGVAVGLLMFGGAVGVSALFGFIEFEQGDPQKQGLSALLGVLLVYLGWTVQGPAEEALTRGWLMPVIGARYRPWLGVLVSSLLFAFLHSLNPNLSGIAMMNLFLFGVFAAVYALYEGGLWGVFSIHAVWNWMQGNLLGFEVSGSLAPGGTLFNLREVGPDTITGGAFGPEGGLAVTGVLILGIAVVVYLSRRKMAETTGIADS
jgi:membrane protease YdiL (CAAX protease family)